MFGQDKISRHSSQEKNLLVFFAVSAYGMGKEGQKSSSLLLAGLLLASSGQNAPLNENSHKNICCCLFNNV